ncbi:TetR/AcrR family transcriptional regulator [Salinirubrum litoreum]|uniref:TetR/AcrR family transcriptional regulator n=1 Tax=Salinirubrum litoreum TaxID=1126234 RepID=A0ABD5RDN9_9EURY|nr:TetR/AcrR family transcriptional regulator [Salinirubrum litoreum]
MRGFTPEQESRIRTQLLETGHELFSTYGLRKTTIEDLTSEVDIGTSTFYRFFDSKEELFLAVLEREGERVLAEFHDRDFDEADDPAAATAAFLRFIMDEIETNPLVETMLVDVTRQQVAAHLSEAEREADRESDIALIRSFVADWVDDDAVHGEDPDVVAGAIRAITFLTLHREDIGEESYPEVRDFVIETFARGLVADA